MVVPDFMLIAEIMLVAEGFIDARILSRKFLTLYTLCKDLLSKQDHYDWGLRAIKSVLVVAGALKRGDKGRPEDQVSRITAHPSNIYMYMYVVMFYYHKVIVVLDFLKVCVFMYRYMYMLLVLISGADEGPKGFQYSQDHY